MTNGERLRAWRAERQLSQVDFARSVGCSPMTLSQLERGLVATPALHVGIRIERVTRGVVAAIDWPDTIGERKYSKKTGRK